MLEQTEAKTYEQKNVENGRPATDLAGVNNHGNRYHRPAAFRLAHARARQGAAGTAGSNARCGKHQLHCNYERMVGNLSGDNHQQLGESIYYL